MNYWLIETWSGEIIQIGPKSSLLIKQRIIECRDIDLGNRIIAYKNIKDFRESDKVWIDKKQLDTSQAAVDSLSIFNIPEYDNNGSIICKWVRKAVPRREWEAYYAPLNYRLINQSDGQMLIAFKLPTNMISQAVSLCSNDEIEYLERQIQTH